MGVLQPIIPILQGDPFQCLTIFDVKNYFPLANWNLQLVVFVPHYFAVHLQGESGFTLSITSYEIDNLL